MKTEFEATFENIDKNKMRDILSKIGAKMVKKEFLQRRCVFHLPKGNEIKGGWLRVRDEQDKVTLSLKIVDDTTKIQGQKELELKVDDFNNACELLESIGCTKKAYQENYREKWILGDVEITLDEWPYLEPYIEIEGNSEDSVKEIVKKLGFIYENAIFGSVDGMYAKKYNIPNSRINDDTPEILFNMEKNPFID